MLPNTTNVTWFSINAVAINENNPLPISFFNDTTRNIEKSAYQQM